MAKVLVTIEDPLLKRIDRTVRERGLTRSGYLSELARRDLDAQLGPGADPQVRAALRRMQDLVAGLDVRSDEDTTSLLRRTRDERLDQLG
ncbi:type II toxin-antitoxin system HicB family antitoxin [Conexibacter woesei]|uniref:Ribbon-helix-helix protein CopG domain-containing protein n=1 Tax=Conexibacter woesei (strain DSM 14684 / CCUG 47730 / CIP 108061 / JCM 11494 / NBRC 100937 / ID131577) TaxID=469383 RepID=D3F4Z9_CONWI|nr:hypothetical protein [Conexibacter woesei]ADB48577.1 hypothetical protein Cwoe_0141 [Conexibacter woesei DSM 14684]